MDDMNKHLLQAWSVAYEKAIVEEHHGLSKNVIDKACCYAVEDWTTRLQSLGAIETIQGKIFDTISDCINHHVDNLIKGGMWNENDRPILIPTDDINKTVLVEIPVCGYRDGCKWGLNEKYFFEKEKFRCQRLGCFVGAVRKYMKDELLTQPEKVAYFMINFHQEAGCKGILFISEERFFRASLLVKYLGKTIS